MNSAEFVRELVSRARELSDSAMSGITDEQFNWVPPQATLNPIKAAYLHLLAGEDIFFHSILRSGPTLWATEGWPGRIGLEHTPGGGQGWEEARNTHVALAPVQEYAAAVRSAADDYLAGLTDEELDRQVSFFGRESTVARVLSGFAMHMASHAGEIATVKGMQGVKGLPF